MGQIIAITDEDNSSDGLVRSTLGSASREFMVQIGWRPLSRHNKTLGIVRSTPLVVVDSL